MARQKRCQYCGHVAPRDELISGRCDSCAAFGRRSRLPSQNQSSPTGLHVKSMPIPNEVQEHSERLLTSVSNSLDSVRKRKSAIHEIVPTSTTRLRGLLDALRTQYLEVADNSISLSDRSDIEWHFNDSTETQLMIVLGPVSCEIMHLNVDIQPNGGLRPLEPDYETVWTSAGYFISAKPIPNSLEDCSWELKITTASELLSNPVGLKPVIRAHQRASELNERPRPPKPVVFPNSVTAEALANDVARDAAHYMELRDLLALDEISVSEYHELREAAESLKCDWEYFEEELNGLYMARLLEDAFVEIQAEIGDAHDVPPAPKQTTKTYKASSTDAAFKLICKHLFLYFETELSIALDGYDPGDDTTFDEFRQLCKSLSSNSTKRAYDFNNLPTGPKMALLDIDTD